MSETAQPLSQAQRIDAVCRRFEQAWKAGPPPRIADYLGDISEPERSFLLRELIALDMDYRRKAGETTQVEEYQAQFPSRISRSSPLCRHPKRWLPWAPKSTS
jgi:hypothetical protein